MLRRRNWRAVFWGIVLILTLQACQPPLAEPSRVVVTDLPAPALTVARSGDETSSTFTPEIQPLPSETGIPVSSPDPFEALTIDFLAGRRYGGGEVTVHETMAQYETFTRYLVSYPSDGLDIYGFLNMPYGSGPFPVVIAIHGYIDPEDYQTIDYTTRYADALARAGFVVVHPNLRGYGPSDNGENLFRIGMAEDILNLVAIIRENGGDPGVLETADPDRIGLWGHSMGGGITLRVITVDPGIKAAVLYGAMSGDEEQNFRKIFEWSEGTRGLEEEAFPASELVRISPIYFLDRIRSAVSIHHGEADALVPLSWSEDLCGRLEELSVDVDCYYYPDQPHTFNGGGDQVFIPRTIDFFQEKLGE
jgi:uncharacterized protein